MNGQESIARHELIAIALSLGIDRPDALSTEQLTDLIREASEAGQVESASSGWFAVARHLVESVVEQGLNLPSAAKVLRAMSGRMWPPNVRPRPPLPTVTLAQIYLSQGHTERARTTLNQVLARQPENHKARRLLDELDASEATAGSDSPAEVESPLGSAPPPSNDVEVAQSYDGRREEEPHDVAPAELPHDYDDLGNAPHSVEQRDVEQRDVEQRDVEQRDVEHRDSEDVVVVVTSNDGVRVCWELGGRGAQLAPDQGIELLVRVFQPSPGGTLVREQRHAISTLTGVRGVTAGDRAMVRAALIDVQEGATVLGVAPVYRASAPGLLELDSPVGEGTFESSHAGQSAHSLALRMLASS